MKRTKNRKIRIFLLLAVLLAATVAAAVIAARVLYPAGYSEQVVKYAAEYDLDPYLVFAVIKAESGFDPNALSKKNARGLMQVADKTGEWAAKAIKIQPFTPEDLYNPDINIRIGCWFLHFLSKQYKGNADLVIAAYNAGNGNVSSWLKDKSLSSTGESLDKIPFGETDRYLKKVKTYHRIYKKLYAGDFD